jgi:arginine/ornithine transport system permease protein
MEGGGFDFALIGRSLPDLVQGLVLTIRLTVVTVLGGIVLAVPLGILRASRIRWASRAIWVYTYFFRGTPMLIQLFLIYYGLSEFKVIRASAAWPFLREGYWCCLLAFTLNTAAYTIEIIAGAIRNVPREDVETAKAMGMSKALTMRRIILPIAFRIMLPSYTNEVVFILQSTSLASLVTVLDLTGAARVIIARTAAPYELFITIGLIYLGLTYVMLWGFRALEGRWYRHLGTAPLARDAELALR